mgnify:CR=1 FL=1
MKLSFKPHQGLIVVRAELTGPSGKAILRLALDTGATSTLINVGMLVAVGYDPALSRRRVEVTTGSGIEFAPRILASILRALGQSRLRFPILAHTLPPSAGVDGLLGLDFLRGKKMTLDFQTGKITMY